MITVASNRVFISVLLFSLPAHTYPYSPALAFIAERIQSDFL